MGKPAIYTVDQAQAGRRLDRFLRFYYPNLPFSRLVKAVRKGEIRIDGKKIKPEYRLIIGQSISLPSLAMKPNQTIKPIKNTKPDEILAEKLRAYHMIYEDDSLLVLNKPAGIAVQGGSTLTTHIDATLPALVAENATYRPMLVHRLDKDTSGVLVVAKTPDYAAMLASAFRRRQVLKTYLAICVGVPDREEGHINLALSKTATDSFEKMTYSPDDGVKAQTDFRVIDYAADRLSLVALYPKTGRTHQLRVHMAAIETPILGDRKYGGTAAFLGGAYDRKTKLHLHARGLSFPEMGLQFEAPLPPHFTETLDLTGLTLTDIS